MKFFVTFHLLRQVGDLKISCKIDDDQLDGSTSRVTLLNLWCLWSEWKK